MKLQEINIVRSNGFASFLTSDKLTGKPIKHWKLGSEMSWDEEARSSFLENELLVKTVLAFHKTVKFKITKDI
ncbi:hypothetical protein [Myxosarcina sp. GI1(2024)]